MRGKHNLRTRVYIDMIFFLDTIKFTIHKQLKQTFRII